MAAQIIFLYFAFFSQEQKASEKKASAKKSKSQQNTKGTVKLMKRKTPKNSDTQKICCSHPKIEQGGFTVECKECRL